MKELNHNDLLKIIPQRYPFLMVDKVTIHQENQATGTKAVSGNEGFFQGHFPGNPIMPGVLIVEAMGQTAAALLGESHPDKLGMFVGLDKVKFKKTVLPGDLLILNVNVLYVKHSIGKVLATAMVGVDVVAVAEIKFVLAPKNEHTG